MQADLLADDHPDGHFNFGPPPTTLDYCGGGLLGATIVTVNKASHLVWDCLMRQRVIATKAGIL